MNNTDSRDGQDKHEQETDISDVCTAHAADSPHADVASGAATDDVANDSYTTDSSTRASWRSKMTDRLMEEWAVKFPERVFGLLYDENASLNLVLMATRCLPLMEDRERAFREAKSLYDGDFITQRNAGLEALHAMGHVEITLEARHSDNDWIAGCAQDLLSGFVPSGQESLQRDDVFAAGATGDEGEESLDEGASVVFPRREIAQDMEDILDWGQPNSGAEPMPDSNESTRAAPIRVGATLEEVRGVWVCLDFRFKRGSRTIRLRYTYDPEERLPGVGSFYVPIQCLVEEDDLFFWADECTRLVMAHIYLVESDLMKEMVRRRART